MDRDAVEVYCLYKYSEILSQGNIDVNLLINNEIKLTLQLIEVNSGNHVWSDNYIRDTENIFELQEDVAISVASALNAVNAIDPVSDC